MGGKSQTVGYRYYLGLHAAICHGPVDKVLGMYVGDREAWTGDVSTTTQIEVEAEGLFGGEDREGGVSGFVDILMGDADQEPNDYLGATAGADQPGYRGFVSMVFRKFYWSAMNPYIKAVSMKVRHITRGRPWYTAKAAIGQNMNPAHILYACVTDPDWGMGYPESDMNDAEWRTAADTLYDEGFGLSLMWSQQDSIENFMKIVLSHIDGSVLLNRETGQFTLKLVRNDFDVEDLMLLDATNCRVTSFQRRAWGETANEVVVQYTDPANEKTASVTVQDPGNIRAQGAVVSQTRQYQGIRDPNLAYRVAERDLLTLSTPLAKISIQANRTAAWLAPGFAIRVTWPEFEMNEAVFRVVSIDYGTLDNGEVRIDAVEDVFILPAIGYGEGQGGLWENPAGPATQIVDFRVEEATYYEYARAAGDSIAIAVPGDKTAVIAFAAKPTPSSNQAMRLYAYPSNSPSSATQVGRSGYAQMRTLTAAIDDVTTTLPLNSAVVGLTAPFHFYVDDEIMGFVSIAGLNMTVQRGLFDTVPRAHASGAKAFFHGLNLTAEEEELRDVDEVRNYWAVGQTVSDVADITGAPRIAKTMKGRLARPLPPGNVRINGQYRPSTVPGALARIEWSHRNRLTQSAPPFVAQTAGSITPETGTYYALELYYKNTGDTDWVFSERIISLPSTVDSIARRGDGVVPQDVRTAFALGYVARKEDYLDADGETLVGSSPGIQYPGGGTSAPSYFEVAGRWIGNSGRRYDLLDSSSGTKQLFRYAADGTFVSRTFVADTASPLASTFDPVSETIFISGNALAYNSTAGLGQAGLLVISGISGAFSFYPHTGSDSAARLLTSLTYLDNTLYGAYGTGSGGTGYPEFYWKSSAPSVGASTKVTVDRRIGPFVIEAGYVVALCPAAGQTSDPLRTIAVIDMTTHTTVRTMTISGDATKRAWSIVGMGNGEVAVLNLSSSGATVERWRVSDGGFVGSSTLSPTPAFSSAYSMQIKRVGQYVSVGGFGAWPIVSPNSPSSAWEALPAMDVQVFDTLDDFEVVPASFMYSFEPLPEAVQAKVVLWSYGGAANQESHQKQELSFYVNSPNDGYGFSYGYYYGGQT